MIKPYGPQDAKILIVGEGPTRNDLRAGRIFSGSLGKDLAKMLHEAGILHSECYITSVCRKYIPGWNSNKYFQKYTKAQQLPIPEVAEGMEKLREEIELVRPNLIIALGELPLWALTGESGITKWRGSILSTPGGQKIIPTYSPESIQRKYDWRFIAVQDLRRCERESHFPEVRMPEYRFIIRPSFEDVVGVLDGLRGIADGLRRGDDVAAMVGTHGRVSSSAGTIACPEKTAPISAHNPSQSIRPFPTSPSIRDKTLILGGDIETKQGHIACFGIAWNTLEALVIPFTCVEDKTGYWSEQEELEIVWRIVKLFRHPNIRWVFQNGIYDYQYFTRHWGAIGKLWMDTMLAHHVCWAGLPKGLDFISSLYCQFHRYWKDEGKEFHASVKSPDDEDKYWLYNAKDCVAMLEAAFVLDKVLDDLGRRESFNFQMRQFPAVLSMMLRGVRIDHKKKDQLALELMNSMAPREQMLHDILGRPFNPKSPKQMQELFYEELGLPVQRNKKTKRPSTDSAALRTLAEKEPLVAPLVQLIEEYRSLGVFLSTFVKASPDTDGRMRSSYNIAGTETFRWSSSKDAFGTGMNLQNLSKGTEK